MDELVDGFFRWPRFCSCCCFLVGDECVEFVTELVTELVPEDVGAIRLARTTFEKAPMPRGRTTSQHPFNTCPGSASCAGVTLAGVLPPSTAAVSDPSASVAAERPEGRDGDLRLARSLGSGGSVGSREGGSRAHLLTLANADACESVGLGSGESCTTPKPGTVCLPKTRGPLDPDRVRVCVCRLLSPGLCRLTAADPPSDRIAEGRFDRGLYMGTVIVLDVLAFPLCADAEVEATGKPSDTSEVEEAGRAVAGGL